MSEQNNLKVGEINKTYVYGAVRCVGALKPVFDAQQNGFLPPELTVAGTGFWIKDFGCFVTCAHVVDQYLGRTIDESGMLVVGGNGQSYERATIGVIDYQHDLALLNINFTHKDDFKKEVMTGLSIAGNDPSIGQGIAYAGFPFGNKLLDANHTPTYSEGVVGKAILHTLRRTEIQFTGPVVGGYSGSPVVLRESPDKLVGVLSNGPMDHGNTGNIFKGIHWKHVLALCEVSGK
ncbi:MAG: trypsin-like peptidase domain-containing protein [Lentisphaerae bacterium]|nr:trypsin-like peptidase domain-containing protein [Lentisphaerota bacterium]